MDNQFWQERWVNSDIKFDQKSPNTYLLNYHSALGPLAGKKILVPLCGKSIDMLWFLNQGAEVIGVELSPIAAEAFFKEKHLEFEKILKPPFVIYRGQALTIFCGDFFNLQKADIGEIDIVYDRAAFIALPYDVRVQYVHHLTLLMPQQSQLFLIAMHYKTDEKEHPPYSVSHDEIQNHFTQHFDCELLHHEKNPRVSPHLVERGLTQLQERTYRMTKKS